MDYKSAAFLAAMNYAMLNGSDPTTIHNAVVKETHPWDYINLSKQERKGKSFEELQALRKSKYEESTND